MFFLKQIFRGTTTMLLLSVCMPLFLFAQHEGKHAIRHSETDSIFSLFSGKSGDIVQTPGYLLVRFNGHLPLGAPVIRALNDNTVIVPADEVDKIPSLQLARVSPANNNWKLSSLSLLEKIKNEQQLIILSGGSIRSIMSLLKNEFPSIPVLHVDTASRAVVIRAGSSVLKQLMLRPEVTFIDLQAGPETEIGIIGYDPGFHGISSVAKFIAGADGKNIVVGVKEQMMDANDIDLYKRVLPSPISSAEVSSHATVISSIIGGAGNSFYDGLGIASGCSFFPSSFSNLFADDVNVLHDARVTLQNHSYGTIIQSFYGAEALSYDAQAASSDIIHVFSAGNQGSGTPAEGRYAGIAGYANLTGNFKAAKNIITVGAVDNKGNIPAASSSGPLYDGRLAPQLIALGPNGTSDAAAMVTGTIAVLQQLFKDSNHQQLPPSSLIRSVLYSSADDIYQPGIDYKTGYGLLNSFKAAQMILQKSYITGTVASGVWERDLSVPANTAQLKITLSWNDPPASLNNYKALINDLDLQLVELNTGRLYLPWVLNSYPQRDSLALLPSRQRDSLNTSEQISIRLPEPGVYRLKVTSHTVLSAPVGFSIAYCIDTLESFRFVSPLQAADVNREENPVVNIRWTSEPADSLETGELFVSYDQGAGWRSIATSVKLTSRLFEWNIPDTSAVARLKMVTSTGQFISGDFVITSLIRPRADFVCTDSFRLSWRKHIYASSYELYSLGEEPYLKPLMSTADTFVVVDRRKYPSMVYAVQPLLTNHLPASRSIALNIGTAGVQCFYRTLNYVLEDANRIKMILDLSADTYADSVFFQEVSVNGTLLRVFDGQKALTGQQTYVALADPPAPGTIYIRAAIRLHNGVLVYTDIISVITSGKKNVLFYPNPVRRSEPIRYMMKQGVSPDCRLQICNAEGRLVKDLASLPPSIDVSSLMSGIYLFRLIDRSGKVIAAEKIIVP